MSSDRVPKEPNPKLGISHLMTFIAGLALSFHLFHRQLKGESSGVDLFMTAITCICGGVTLGGFPMLLIDRIKHRRNWQSGAFSWFAHQSESALLAWSIKPMNSEE